MSPLRAFVYLSFTCVAVLLPGGILAESDLVIHEWGTFTSYQDEHGGTIGGINVDDEPVPGFVHRLPRGETFLRTPQFRQASWSQGAPRCHPEVTLRLETPVVYFYPSVNTKTHNPFEIVVDFRGGWVTEYFPKAQVTAHGFPNSLHQKTVGSIRWKGVTFHDDSMESKVPATDQHVWLAPRKVASSLVSANHSEEVERYLFYRGVGHLDSPIVVKRDGASVHTSVRAGSLVGNQKFWKAHPMYLLHVLPDGKAQFRVIRVSDNKPAALSPNGYTSQAVAQLRTELKTLLISNGLFSDEAHAMLETWKLSYFESPGLRLFFLLPKDWLGEYLPLNISRRADVTRVMVGRVEMVSPEQQQLLDKIYAMSEAELSHRAAYVEFIESPDYQKPEFRKRYSQSFSLPAWEFRKKMGMEIPKGLEIYQKLGRFRDALLAHEIKQQRDPKKKKLMERVFSQYSTCR